MSGGGCFRQILNPKRESGNGRSEFRGAAENRFVARGDVRMALIRKDCSEAAFPWLRASGARSVVFASPFRVFEDLNGRSERGVASEMSQASVTEFRFCRHRATHWNTPRFLRGVGVFSKNQGGYIPGSFIPASRRAKLGFPICLNILRIWAYCRSRLFTSGTLVPEPRAIRLRREPLMASWCSRS